MIPLTIIIHLISLGGLLYISIVMVVSKKTSLQTAFFTINKTYNFTICLYLTFNIIDYSIIHDYIPCPSAQIFTFFKFFINTILTAFSVAQFQMVLIRYKIVTNAKVISTNQGTTKYLLFMWITAILNSMPIFWVEFRIDERMNTFAAEATSTPYLIFDTLEGISSSVCFLLSVHFTLRILLFMRTHKKRWNLYVLHAFLSTFVPIALITYQWLKVAWRMELCQMCEKYADNVRSLAGPITLTVVFSIVVCSTEVRREVVKPFRILFRPSGSTQINVVFSVS